MVIVPYAGKYFGRKFAYWSEFYYVHVLGPPISTNSNESLGWAKYMEWMYPVEVRFTSSKTFKAAGAVEVAASI